MASPYANLILFYFYTCFYVAVAGKEISVTCGDGKVVDVAENGIYYYWTSPPKGMRPNSE